MYLNLKWKDVSTSRLLDLKLKCIFESTEADQNKQINDASTATFGNTTIPFSTSVNSTVVDPKQVKPVAAAATHPTSRMSTARQSDVFANADSNDYELKTGGPIVNSTPIVQTTNSQMPAPAQPARPTPPAAAPAVSSSVTSGRQADTNNKNENLVNELKLAMQDNEALKREVARLKVSTF